LKNGTEILARLLATIAHNSLISKGILMSFFSQKICTSARSSRIVLITYRLWSPQDVRSFTHCVLAAHTIQERAGSPRS
jgi:hypothetical protein